MSYFTELLEKEESLLYKDDTVMVFIDPTPLVKGQLRIVPAKEKMIMQELTDEEIARLLGTANKMSMILFEKFQCQGTNMLIQNGTMAGQTIPHFSIIVLPRWENDDIDLSWTPLQISPTELDSTAMLISKFIGEFSGSNMNESNMGFGDSNSIESLKPKREVITDTLEEVEDKQDNTHDNKNIHNTLDKNNDLNNQENSKPKKSENTPEKKKVINYLIKHIRRVP